MPRSRGPRFRPTISLVLTGGVGLLMILAGLAYAIAMVSGRQNTVDLLRDRNERILNRLVERTHLQLGPVQRQVEALRNRIQRGQIEGSDVSRLSDYMSAALDGLPQVDAFAYVRNNMLATRAIRVGSSIHTRHDDISDYANSAIRL